MTYLMYKLMEYRNQEIRQRLEKVGSAASMLHLDVLLIIYHFAKITPGNVLEISPYVGGSTIAAAFEACESVKRKKIISVEAGGRLKHRRIPSRNIFKDLKKNLARFGVSESVTLINGYSFQETTISAIRQCWAARSSGSLHFRCRWQRAPGPGLLWRSAGPRLLACDRRLFRTRTESSAHPGASRRTRVRGTADSLRILWVGHLDRPVAAQMIRS